MKCQQVDAEIGWGAHASKPGAQCIRWMTIPSKLNHSSGVIIASLGGGGRSHYTRGQRWATGYIDGLKVRQQAQWSIISQRIFSGSKAEFIAA